MDIYSIFIQCHKCNKSNKLLIWNERERFYCTDCGELLFKAEKPSGIIYILSHKNMPGLVKIGITSDSIKNRVKQLSSATGVPGKFTVEAWFVSNKPEKEERKIHEKLKKRKEWSEHFRVDANEAVEIVVKILNGREPVFRRKSKGVSARIVSIQSEKKDNTHDITVDITEGKAVQGSLFDNTNIPSSRCKTDCDKESPRCSPDKHGEEVKKQWYTYQYEPKIIRWTCAVCGMEYKILASADTASSRVCLECSRGDRVITSQNMP